MIKSFSNKDLENLYYGDGHGINPDHIKKLERILDRLNQAKDVLKDMNSRNYRLHKLEPRTKERWSVDVNKNWRVTFIFKEENAYEVDYWDTH